MMKGVIGQQNSYLTVIVVHEMHYVHVLGYNLAVSIMH